MKLVEKFLIVEDAEDLRREISVIFAFCGFEVLLGTAKNWKDSIDSCLDELDKSLRLEVPAVFIGYCGKSQEKILEAVIKWRSDIPIVLLGSKIGSNVIPEHIKKRMVGSLTFPFLQSEFMSIIHSCYLCRENWKLPTKLQSIGQPNNFFRRMAGESQKMSAVRHAMQQVAKKNVIVLLTGESGTGKKVAARCLHDAYACDKPFVPVNCSAIPPDLLEAELFGYEKGAFNKAVSAREGRFELAQGGTLFLDDIEEMPLSLQAKLVSVLQEFSFKRIGGTKSIDVNVRIIVATQKDLELLVREGLFREDLFYRINIFPIRLPALRERPEDIPFIINDLLNCMESENRGVVRLSSAALNMLCDCPWSGNVREVSNLMERLSIMYPYGVIGTNDLPQEYAVKGNNKKLDHDLSTLFPEHVHKKETIVNDNLMVLPAAGLNIKELLANLEKSLIQQAILDSRGVVARAAGKLQIRRTTLIEKMRKYGLQRHQKVY